MIVKRKTVFRIEIPVKSNDYDGSDIYHIFHVYNDIYAVVYHAKYRPKGYSECVECGHSAKFYSRNSLVKFLKKLEVSDKLIKEIVTHHETRKED